MNKQSIKDKIGLLPLATILILNIAVMVVFINSVLLNQNYGGIISWHYFLLICLVALAIFLIRILIVGKTTILYKYFARTQNDWLFILFICFIVSILVTTWAINFFSIDYFLDFFKQDLQNSPVSWFNILDNNFHFLTFYAFVFVLLNLPVVYLFFKFKVYQQKNYFKIDEEPAKMGLLFVGCAEIFIFLWLFVSDPMLSFWQHLLNLNVFKTTLSFIFSGSLIYFNLSFLFRGDKR